MLQQDNIFVLPIQGALTTRMGVFFNAGAATEDQDKKGVAHLCEHLLVQSGHEVDAETQHELMYFGMEGVPEDIYADFSKLLVSLFESKITEDRLRHEKEIITRELCEQPPLFAYTKGMELVFGEDSPLAQPAGGSVESIRKLSLEDIEMFKAQLSPENALFVAVGAVEQSRFMKFIEPYVRKRAPLEGTTSGSKSSVTEYIVDQDDELANIHVFIPTIAIGALRERIGLALARTALAGHAFSLLNTALREEHMFTYTLDTDTSYFTKGGFLHVSFTTAPGNAEKACEEVDRVLRTFPDLLTQELFERSKKQLCTEALGRTHDVSALAWWHGEDLLLAGETIPYPQGFCEKVQSLTLEEVKELSARFFAREYRVTML